MSVEPCRFCLNNGLLVDSPVSETDLFYVLKSQDPLLPHAAMVIPRRHSQSPIEMTGAEWAELPLALGLAQASLAEPAPDGFTIGWNVGAAAGQTVSHTHLHVIARFAHEPTAGQGIRHPLKRRESEEGP
ncbi:MAG: HIT family protein [Devosia sp.]|uniref:HIT family protein n=1 Tax=Devosia sp. TaxID=1871048 RepID=UPI0024CC8172|nr:HIT family protein [Devosia sp.]UYO00628.1 MAG: HIT family protein [Devosia sp.]